MPKHITKTAKAYKVEIFIGGDLADAKVICLAYCTEVGLCVTVEPTTYVYRNGMCEGVRIGLINYARFATDNHERDRVEIWSHAMNLAFLLREGLGQGSYTVQNDKVSHFYSEREVDLASEG